MGASSVETSGGEAIGVETSGGEASRVEDTGVESRRPVSGGQASSVCASGKEGSLVFAWARASPLLKNVIHISATKLYCSCGAQPLSQGPPSPPFEVNLRPF